jgi:hypothetical protein
LSYSFLNIGRKLQALVESRTIRYGDERIKAENIRHALGITYPTYLKYKDGDIEPSELKVKDIEIRLNGWTNIEPKIAVADFSDKSSLEEFCAKFRVVCPPESEEETHYIELAAKRRLLNDHPFDDFSLNLREAKAALRHLKGVYRLLRNNGTGAPVLQSVLHVKGLLSLGKKVQIVSQLSVPSIGGEVDHPYTYTGIVCTSREAYYWFFNQDDLHRRDFIILVTTRNGTRSFGGEYVSIGQDYFPIPQSGTVGLERIEAKIGKDELPQFIEEESRVFQPGDKAYLDKLSRLYELNKISGRGLRAHTKRS